MTNKITYGTTDIHQATYYPDALTSRGVNLQDLQENLKDTGLPDLIGTLIRLICKDAKGDFDLKVSHEKATLILSGPPSTTTVITLTGGKWQKTVNGGSAEHVFKDLSQSTEYTRLTTLFIATVGRQRSSTAAAPAPISNAQPFNTQPLSSSTASATHSSNAAQAPSTSSPFDLSSQPSHTAQTESSKTQATLQEQINIQADHIKKLESEIKEQQTANVSKIQTQHAAAMTALKTELTQAQTNLQDTARNLELKKEELSRLQEALTESQSSNASTAEQLQAAQTHNTQQQQTVSSLQAQLQEKEASVTRLQSELETVRANIDSLQSQIAQKEETHQADLANLAQQQQALTEALNQITPLQQEIKNLTQSQQTTQEENSRLTEQVTIQKDLVLSSAENLERKNLELQGIRTAAEHSQALISELKTQLAQAEAKLTEHNQQEELVLGTDTSNDDIERLRKELEDEKNKGEEIRQKWEETSKELDRLRSLAKPLLSVNHEAGLEDEHSDIDISHIMQANQALEKDNDRLLEEIQEVQKLNEQLRSQVLAQSTRIRELEEHLRTKNDISEEVKQKTDLSNQLEEEVKKLKQELSNVEAILSENQKQFEEKLTSLTETLTSLKTDNESLRKALEKQAAHSEPSDISIELLKQKLEEEYKGDLQKLADQNASLHLSNQNLNQELQQLIDDQEKSLEDYRQIFDSITDRLFAESQEKDNTILKLEKETLEKQKQLLEQQKKITQLTSDIKEEQEKTALLHKRNQQDIEDQRLNRTQLQEVLIQQKKDIDQNSNEFKRQLHEKDKIIQQQSETLVNFEDGFKRIQEKLESQTKYNDELQTRLADQQAEHAAFTEEFEKIYKKFAEENKNLKTSNQGFLESITKVSQRNEQLEQEIALLKEAGRTSPKSPTPANDHSDEIKKLEEEVNGLRRDNKGLLTEVSQLKEELVKANNIIDSSSESDNDELQTSQLKQVKLKKELSALNESLAGMVAKEDFDALKKQLEEKEEEITLSLASIQTMTEEAIDNIKRLTNLSEEDAKQVFLAILKQVQGPSSEV